MNDQKNTILAIVLSALVLIGWQIYFAGPQAEKQKQAQQQQQALERSQQPPPSPQSPTTQQQTGAPPAPQAAPPAPGQAATTPTMTREAALAASPRVHIETPSVSGSIALKGGRIDDVSLTKYRETVDPKSPPIVLYSPSGTAEPYYAEFGWVPATGVTAKLPDAQTLIKRSVPAAPLLDAVRDRKTRDAIESSIRRLTAPTLDRNPR